MTAYNELNTIPAHIRENESYKDAVSYMENFRAREGVDYGWAIEYAKMLWEERNKHSTAMDEKADSIIKYLGGGLGLFSLAALAKVDASNAYLIIWALPSVGCAILSLFFAASVRAPNPIPTLPPIKTVTDYAEEEKNGQVDFLGKWHVACEGYRLANRDKAKLLQRATWFYCSALAFLVLPLLVAVLSRG